MGGFKTNSKDLIKSLTSLKLDICAEIEHLLLSEILAPDVEVVTVLIAKNYGAGTGQENVPLTN